MATTLGGVALAEPAFGDEGFELEAVDIGNIHQLASGAIGYDYVDTRWRATLRWQRITAAEVATIKARYIIKTAQALVGPDGTTFTGFVLPNSWRQSYVEDGSATARYNCEMQVEESA